MDLAWIIACTVVVVVLGFIALAVYGFKSKKWSRFAIVFIFLLLTSLGVRVFGLYFNYKLHGLEDCEINVLILFFKSLYSIIGGLQFEGIDDIEFNHSYFDWYNCFLLPLYYILPIIVGLLTLTKLSQSLVYEYYCKIKWRLMFKSKKEIYVFTSLTDDTLQLARSTFKQNTKAKIVFYGNHIPAFDNHNLLCRRIKSYGWYYFTNLDGKKKYKDSKKLEDSDRRFESSILNKLHLVKNNYMKLCIISMHLNDDLTPNDELNLDISYREYQTYIDCILKHCLGKYFFNNRTLYLFLYYSDFIINRSADPDIDTVKERFITLYNQLIESNSSNDNIKKFLKDRSRHFKGPYNLKKSDPNLDLETIKDDINVDLETIKVLFNLLLESKKDKNKFSKFLKKKRIGFEKKLKTFSKTLELYTLVGKEINYQAYQQTIDDFKDQVKVYLGALSKNEDYDVNEGYCPPEFYILNEASLVADDLIESINECNKLCQFDDDNKKITKGIVVGFGEIGQNTLHNLYTQYNIESEHVVFDIYDSKADNYGPSCYVSSKYCSWEFDGTLYDYKINHPYFEYVLSGLGCRLVDYKDNDKDTVVENTHVDEKAILNDLLTLRLRTTQNLYDILDANSGTQFDEKKDIIVLTTGSDDKNIKYANFLINDIEHELSIKNDKDKLFKQIIAVNIREDINNSLLNLDGFMRITNNVYKRKEENVDLFIIVFGNTDEVYSYKLLDHETDKNYNYGYNLIYDGINGTTSTEIDVKKLKGLAKDYFNNPNPTKDVEKYYEDIVNFFKNISGINYKPKPGEVAKRNKLWKNNNIFDCLSNKSARLFSNNFKSGGEEDPYGCKCLRENITREHNRWFRFYICYGWRYRFKKSKPNKKHDCLINIKCVPEDKRFFDIINVAYSLASVDLEQMTDNFKEAAGKKKNKEKRNESNKNNPDQLETNGQATEEIKRN